MLLGERMRSLRGRFAALTHANRLVEAERTQNVHLILNNSSLLLVNQYSRILLRFFVMPQFNRGIQTFVIPAKAGIQ